MPNGPRKVAGERPPRDHGSLRLNSSLSVLVCARNLIEHNGSMWMVKSWLNPSVKLFFVYGRAPRERRERAIIPHDRRAKLFAKLSVLRARKRHAKVLASHAVQLRVGCDGGPMIRDCHGATTVVLTPEW